MKSKIECSSQEELARYLHELAIYFRQTGQIPIEEGEGVALPSESSVRIRYDKTSKGSTVQITIDWST